MTHPAYLREKARQMRVERRMTIDEIAARLALSRSTIYYWVRELPVPRAGSGGGWPESARRKGNQAMQAKYRELRRRAYEDGQEEFDTLARDPTFRDFICLYIAEGSKRTRHAVAICNSDRAVMQLAVRWMREFTRRPMSYSIQYHADQDLEEITRVWGVALNVDPHRIRLQRKSNSNQLSGRTWRSEYGVLTAVTNDTLFRARLAAWVDCLRTTWD